MVVHSSGNRVPVLSIAARKKSISYYIDYPHLVAALCSAIDARDPGIAALALEVLLGIGGEREYETVRALCRALLRPDMPLKFESIRVLGWCKPAAAAAAVPILMRLLVEGEDELRFEAAATLEALNIEARPAIPSLIAVMGNAHAADELRQAAAMALVACAPRDVDLQPTTSPVEDDRRRVLDALCALGDQGTDVRHRLQDAWRSPPEVPQEVNGPSAKKTRGGPRHPKRSTQPGEAQVKMIGYLTTHHKLADGGCLNQEPIACNELARGARVAKSTASEFFDRAFGENDAERPKGYQRYRRLCNDVGKLTVALRALNGELLPRDFIEARTPEEVEDQNEREAQKRRKEQDD